MNNKFKFINECDGLSRIKYPQTGFTLVELMVAVAVLGVVTVFALPNFTATIKNNRFSTQASDLLSDLAFARSQAATLGLHVSICTSPDTTVPVAALACATAGTDWKTGRLIYVDVDASGTYNAGDTLLRVRDALSGGNTLTATGVWAGGTYRIQYRPSGIPISNIGNLDICDNRPGATGRRIALSATGRASSVNLICP
ncbi:MAG: GspH/FimT family pseudopilin [Burkholderiales bacterium]